MKRFLIMSIAAGVAVTACGPKGEPQLGKASLNKVIDAMTVEEKALLLVGTGMKGFSGDDAVVGETDDLVPGAAGTTHAIPRLGIPAIVLADGPAGLRIRPVREGDSDTYYCTHFPVGTMLASTWNQELVEEVGAAIGEEVLEYGCDVLLAPALNIHRNPLCGRNFEYYSEDPLVSGKTAAAYVRGVQSNGVGTSIKHFAVNNQETNRMGNDARVSPRALREIYLKGFEIAVKEGSPWTVMSSYNDINGIPASHNGELLTSVLRDEWGFDGMVMTDWFGGKDPVAQMFAGNDMLQPGTEMQFQVLVDAMNDGSLPMEVVDRNVARVLELILRSPKFSGYDFSNDPDLQAHAAVTRQSATEGMVLLKNDSETLPLASEVKSVAVFGKTSYSFIAGGTGSGNVNRAYTVSLIDGLGNAGYVIDEELQAVYEAHLGREAARIAKAEEGMTATELEVYPRELPAELDLQRSIIRKAAARDDVALITLGRSSGEFKDRTVADFNLNAAERNLINDVCEAFHAEGKKVVVVLNVAGVIETASWKEHPDAILCAWLAGQEGGNSVADVLSGAASPSGRLPMTFPVSFEDHASSRNFPIDVEVGILGRQRTADAEPERNVDYTEYEEGIYVGYRWFDKVGMEVSYPFGYGLSYTEFEFGTLQLSHSKGESTVSVEVRNSGKRPGKEVVQLYVSAPAGSLDKPVRELKAYAKTRELQPGEIQTVVLKVKDADLASFDEAKSAWVVDAGTYEFAVGTSSRDLRVSVPVEVQASERKVEPVLLKK